ncbi:MAG: ArnT family glycosyltransferase [Pseudomonadota bacterium]
MSRTKDTLSWFCFILILIFIWGLKSFSFRWETGDEAIYLYMSWAALDHGALPYRDYFFAHPPLQLIWSIPFFATFGFNPIATKALPLVATSLIGLIIFLISKEKIGRVAAVTSAFLFFTAFSLLRSSTFWTGIHESVFWAVLGLWFFLHRKPTWAGVSLALGVCTGVYILPSTCLLGVLFALNDRDQLKKYARSFLAVWGLNQAAGFILGGAEYFRSVYLFHFQKPEAKESAWKDTIQQFFSNFSLFWMGLIGFSIVLLERVSETRQHKKKNPFFLIRLRKFVFDDEKCSIALIGSAWALCNFVFLHLLKKRFGFYYLLVFPGLALCGGYLAQRLLDWVLAVTKEIKVEKKIKWSQRFKVGFFSLAFFLSGYALYRPAYKATNPNAFRKKDQEMKWKDSPWSSANSFFKWCCWDDYALSDMDYGNAQETLYRQGDLFEPLNKLVEYIVQNSTKDDTLFGDSITVGLVALLSERRLEKDFADTNTMRFTSKITPVEKAIEAIDNPSLKYVLVGAKKEKDKVTGEEKYRYQRFASVKGFRDWIDTKFKVALTVPTSKTKAYLLFERK